jgi:hypothetical protein
VAGETAEVAVDRDPFAARLGRERGDNSIRRSVPLRAESSIAKLIARAVGLLSRGSIE